MAIVLARLGGSRDPAGLDAQILLALFRAARRRIGFLLEQNLQLFAGLFGSDCAKALGLLDLAVIGQVEQWMQAHRYSS